MDSQADVPAAEMISEPDASKLKAGVTAKKEAWGQINVASAAGQARSHIHLIAEWDVPPEVPFAIFTYPNNSAIFRDVRHVGQRRVTSIKPGYKVVEVQQLQEIQVLWVRRTFSTWLQVEEDSRDPDLMDLKFDLMTSDVLSQFKGHWVITSLKDDSGSVIGCKAELHQDVLPKGIPEGMRNMPVLGNILRGVAMRAIRRVMEDMHKAIDKVKIELSKGRTTLDVLRDMCGACDEEGHANGAVKAMALDDIEDEDEEEEEGEAENQAKGEEMLLKGTAIPQKQTCVTAAMATDASLEAAGQTCTLAAAKHVTATASTVVPGLSSSSAHSINQVDEENVPEDIQVQA